MSKSTFACRPIGASPRFAFLMLEDIEAALDALSLGAAFPPRVA